MDILLLFLFNHNMEATNTNKIKPVLGSKNIIFSPSNKLGWKSSFKTHFSFRSTVSVIILGPNYKQQQKQKNTTAQLFLLPAVDDFNNSSG